MVKISRYDGVVKNGVRVIDQYVESPFGNAIGEALKPQHARFVRNVSASDLDTLGYKVTVRFVGEKGRDDDISWVPNR